VVAQKRKESLHLTESAVSLLRRDMQRIFPKAKCLPHIGQTR